MNLSYRTSSSLECYRKKEGTVIITMIYVEILALNSVALVAVACHFLVTLVAFVARLLFLFFVVVVGATVAFNEFSALETSASAAARSRFALSRAGGFFLGSAAASSRTFSGLSFLLCLKSNIKQLCKKFHPKLTF